MIKTMNDYNTITLKIPKYNPENGLRLEWEKGYSIRITEKEGCILLNANECGLRSLAKHLLCLADAHVPLHYHVHLDDTNSLEDGSVEVVIEKIN